jgi:nucleotide-binding universal stress UspA family protein
MSKIVLSISDRWVADARLGAIASFAQKLDKSILAVHVAYGSDNSGAETTAGEKVLASLASALRAKGAKVETQFLFADDVAAAIVKIAEEQGATMIMAGLSTKGMLTRLIEGNVVQEIIRITAVPVLLLPPEWNGEI